MLTEMYSMLMTGRLFSFIATSFLFILGTASAEAHSVEAKAYVTEINQQSNTPDYYSIAEAGVKKYYPEYENYFKEIINKIKRLGYEKYLINKEIKKELIVSGELLYNEKEIITTILESLEMIDGKENFRIRTGISEDEYIIAKDIRDGFTRTYLRQEKNIDNFTKEIKALKTKESTSSINEISNEFITISEKYMDLLKDFLLNYGYLKESTGYQEWVKQYIETIKETGRTPNKIGQKYIDEYNKIIKK